jgi:hypothetical protein
MTAKIYKPSKTAMQSGRKTKISRGCEWVLAYMRKSAAKPDQLMGWQSSSDTARQVKMYFPDLDSAVAYAEANDIDYVVQQPKSRRVKPRAYADNFAFTRNGALDWVSLASWAKGIWTNRVKTGTTCRIIKMVP